MSAPLRAVNVMIVDDDPDDAELLRRAMAGNGAAGAITCCDDGTEALEVLRGIARGGTDARGGPAPLPDVILLGRHPHRADPCDALAQIKHDPRLKSIPVVVLGAAGTDDDVARAYRNRANSYLVKPADREEFRRMAHDLGRYWLKLNRLAPAREPR